MFYYCKGLTSVTIPNSVTSIGNWAFSNCSGLTGIVIPNSVTSIGYSSFLGCSGLTGIEIPNSVTSIGDYAFSRCSGLTSIEIPNSVTSIGNWAFSYCSGLTSIVIPNSVTSIGESVFHYCSGLTSIEIPNSVTSIGNWAFSYCSGLTSVIIPNSVTSIGGVVFYECNLTSIYVLNEVPLEIQSQTFDNYNATLYVPQGSIEAYKAAVNWGNFANIVEFDVTAIEDVTDDVPAFEITADGIQLTAAEGKVVAVYSTNGALVEKIDAYTGEEITLEKGVYVVCVGNKTMKVRL